MNSLNVTLVGYLKPHVTSFVMFLSGRIHFRLGN